MAAAPTMIWCGNSTEGALAYFQRQNVYSQEMPSAFRGKWSHKKLRDQSNLAASWANRWEICSCGGGRRWCWPRDTSSQPECRWWSTSFPRWSHIHPLSSPPSSWYLNGSVVECVNGGRESDIWEDKCQNRRLNVKFKCMNNQRNTILRLNSDAGV